MSRCRERAVRTLKTDEFMFEYNKYSPCEVFHVVPAYLFALASFLFVFGACHVSCVGMLLGVVLTS